MKKNEVLDAVIVGAEKVFNKKPIQIDEDMGLNAFLKISRLEMVSFGLVDNKLHIVKFFDTHDTQLSVILSCDDKLLFQDEAVEYLWSIQK